MSLLGAHGDVLADGGGGWTTTAINSKDTISPGWDGYTLRQSIPAASLKSGTKIRLTIGAHAAQGFSLAAASIGIRSAASATGSDFFSFTGTPTKLTFGGSGSIAVVAGGNAVSDDIAILIPAGSGCVFRFMPGL